MRKVLVLYSVHTDSYTVLCKKRDNIYPISCICLSYWCYMILIPTPCWILEEWLLLRCNTNCLILEKLPALKCSFCTDRSLFPPVPLCGIHSLVICTNDMIGPMVVARCHKSILDYRIHSMPNFLDWYFYYIVKCPFISYWLKFRIFYEIRGAFLSICETHYMPGSLNHESYMHGIISIANYTFWVLIKK